MEEMKKAVREKINQQMQGIETMLPEMDKEMLARVEWTLEVLLTISRTFTRGR